MQMGGGGGGGGGGGVVETNINVASRGKGYVWMGKYRKYEGAAKCSIDC